MAKTKNKRNWKSVQAWQKRIRYKKMLEAENKIVQAAGLYPSIFNQ